MQQNGFRSPQQLGRKEQIRELKTEMENTKMALRMNQMMIQQLFESNKNVAQDLTRALNLINELQYKILAVQTVAGLDKDKLNEHANHLRLKDFTEASDKEDAVGNFTVVDTVAEDSTVILTSTVDNGEGIFRSRLKLTDTGVPELINGLLGKFVGEKVKVTLNNTEHVIELLGIRQPPKEEVPAETTDPTATA